MFVDNCRVMRRETSSQFFLTIVVAIFTIAMAVAMCPSIALAEGGGLTSGMSHENAPSSEVNVTNEDGVSDEGAVSEVVPSEEPVLAEGETGPVDGLVFSHDSGAFASDITLDITAPEGWVIHYTTDCSTPTVDSPVWEGSLTLSDATPNAGVLSGAEAVALMHHPSAYSFVPNASDCPKANVIRAIAVSPDGSEQTDVETRTYFIGHTYTDYWGDMPVIQMVTDSSNLLDYDTGIMALGAIFDEWSVTDEGVRRINARETWHYAGNYTQHGKEWERPIAFELFDGSDTVTVAQNGGIRVHGGASRMYGQRGFNVYFKKAYGQTQLSHALFPDNVNVNGDVIDSYKSLVLRNGGNDCNQTKFQDVMLTHIASKLNLTTQASRPCVVFLNGEYWGVLNLQEKLSDKSFADMYGVDADNVVVIKDGEVDEGKDEDISLYDDLYAWSKVDLSDDDTYAQFCEAVDIDSMIDYYVVESYIGNVDWWWNKNQSVWRTRDVDESNPYADGKWRWILFDTEQSMDMYHKTENAVDFDFVSHAMKVDPLFGNAMLNHSFRHAFLDRMEQLCGMPSSSPSSVLGLMMMIGSGASADEVEGIFSPASMAAEIDAYSEQYSEFVADDAARFGEMSQRAFDSRVSAMESFTDQRAANIVNATRDVVDTLDGDAVAVFDSSDGSLTFVRAEAGTYTNGEVSGTKTYYILDESRDYGWNNKPWSSKISQIKSVVFKDHIHPASVTGWFMGYDNLETVDLTGLDTRGLTKFDGFTYNTWGITKLIVGPYFDQSENAGSAWCFPSPMKSEDGTFDGTVPETVVPNEPNTYVLAEGRYVEISDGNTGGFSPKPEDGWVSVYDDNNEVYRKFVPQGESVTLPGISHDDSDFKAHIGWTGKIGRRTVNYDLGATIPYDNLADGLTTHGASHYEMRLRDESTSGTAYAILLNKDTATGQQGDFVFFRSTAALTLNTTQTVTIHGKSYTGTVYGDFETEWNPSAFNASNVPWFGTCKNVKRVYMLDRVAPVSMKYWFKNMTACTSMDLSKMDLRRCTSLANTFESVSALTTLDLSSWNTRNVTNMSCTFNGMTKLASLDVSTWNTSNATSMVNMFSNLKALSSLDLGNFDTHNVTSLAYMFDGSSGLTSITGISDWDTSKVTNIRAMFRRTSISSLDLNWDLRSGEELALITAFCENLVSLDLGDIQTTPDLVATTGLIAGCDSGSATMHNLRYVDLSGLRYSAKNPNWHANHFLTATKIRTLKVSDLIASNGREYMGIRFSNNMIRVTEEPTRDDLHMSGDLVPNDLAATYTADATIYSDSARNAFVCDYWEGVGTLDAVPGTVRDVPVLTDHGLEFLGWNTKPDGTGKMYQVGDTIDENDFDGAAILYAMYDGGTVDITYDANGATSDRGVALTDAVYDRQTLDPMGYAKLYTDGLVSPVHDGSTGHRLSKSGYHVATRNGANDFIYDFYMDGSDEPVASLSVLASKECSILDLVNMLPESVQRVFDEGGTVSLTAKPRWVAVDMANTVSNRDRGFIINLFDYDTVDTTDNFVSSPIASGINTPDGESLRLFQFGGRGGDLHDGTTVLSLNGYAGQDYSAYTGVTQGILAEQLDGDGYPVIASQLVGASATDRTTLLADKISSPNEKVSTKQSYDYDPSLAYLFDPDMAVYDNAKRSYKNVDGLFTLDEHGTMVYDSNVRYAYYDVTQGDGGTFTEYDSTYDRDSSVSVEDANNPYKIGFFPFDVWSGQDQWGTKAQFENFNHQFGMTMEGDFMLSDRADGKIRTTNGDLTDMVFDFSGDDDMWVFVDGRLVLDIGGIHQPTRGTINFTTGEVTIEGDKYLNRTLSYYTYGQTTNDHITGSYDEDTNTYSTTLNDIFEGEWDASPMARHSIKMFYLERGGSDSNLSLAMNLLSVSEGPISVQKVWNDENDKLDLRPDELTFSLYGTLYGEHEELVAQGTASEDTGWVCDFGGREFPISNGYGNVAYRVVEDTSWDEGHDYEVAYEHVGDNFVVTNTLHKPLFDMPFTGSRDVVIAVTVGLVVVSASMVWLLIRRRRQ